MKRTESSHVARATEFYDKDDVYFVLGRTTPWEDDNIPPSEDNAGTIDDVLGYKKVETKNFVKPDPFGTIQFAGQKWSIVRKQDAFFHNSRWVMLLTYLYFEDLPSKSYRQVGVVSGLVKEVDVLPGKYNLLPTEVFDKGILECFENRKPVSRQSGIKEKLFIILEF